MTELNLCNLCGHILQPFFSRPEYPIWGGPVISTEQAKHLKFANLRIGICGQCAFMSLIAPKPEDLADLLYADFYSSSNPVCEDPENVNDWRVVQLLDSIDRRVGHKRGSALEIASYDGQFLYQLRKCGWVVAGCEPNPLGQQASEKYGFEVKQKYFVKDLYPPESFDLVVCRFVLEHVPDPLQFLEAARIVLKPGGRIFIEVPDCADRVINRVLGSFVPEHVSYFCKDSLESALRKSGFGGADFEIYQGGIIVNAEPVDRITSQAEPPAYKIPELLSQAASFEAAIARNIELLRSIVATFAHQRKRVAIYGANTQTIEYFNRGGIVEHDFSYVVDDDPYKQGLQLVGTNLPVMAFQNLIDSPVEAILVSAYLSQEKMVKAVHDRCGPGIAVIRFYPTPSVEQ